jgi:hypothetical protein
VPIHRPTMIWSCSGFAAVVVQASRLPGAGETPAPQIRTPPASPNAGNDRRRKLNWGNWQPSDPDGLCD